jgi:uncharacterized protein YjiS (DUF1127 family)
MSPVHVDARPLAVPASLAGAAAPGGLLSFRFARRALSASFRQLLLWQERASQRQRLGMAEDHVLADLGLSRAEVAGEIRKPFWRC